jgi:TPR repeat protein
MKKLLTALVVIVSLGTAGAVCAQDYQKLMVLAEQGYAGAQYNLGDMYRQGKGVARNDKEAMKWWRKAACRANIERSLNKLN